MTIVELRERLSSSGVTVGSWLQIPSPDVAEIMAAGDFDWLTIDMEHGAFDWSTLPNMIRAIESGGVVPLVRIPDQSRTSCARALDSGAQGLIVPNITSAAQIQAVIEAASWPPTGTRGVGFSRANGFGSLFESYRERAQHPFIVAIIENVKALNSLEDLCRIQGVDVVFVGPYDLSASLGATGNFYSERFRTTIAQVLKIAKNLGRPVGVHVISPTREALNESIEAGFQFIASASDAIFLRSGLV
jgi:2-dehydro-3-deoxyglucarate aldolase